MKLWLLKRVDDDLSYDCAHGFVVRAQSEDAARRFAQENGGDEVEDWAGRTRHSVPFWTDPAKTTCIELTADGDAGVVLRDFNAG